MTDGVEARIAAVLELLRPVTPLEAADAVIRVLQLEAVIGLARSWHQNYDTVPAYDPQNPSDSDIAYDDAGFQILHTLGLITDHSKCFGCDSDE